MSVKVGLTGLWGSGKTTVLEIFRQLGAEVLDLDRVVHELLERDEIVEMIKTAFGEEVIRDKRVDRRSLARKAFASQKDKRRLEEIIHPEVLKRMEHFLQKSTGIAVVEVPLLYETSSEKYFDKTVLVKADERLRIERLQQKGYTLEEIHQRLQHQMPEQAKALKADYVIDNSGPKEDTKRQVIRIWEDLQTG